jgi:hypothetical protein
VHGDQDPLDGFPLLDEGDEAQGMVFAAGFTVEVCEASPQDSTRHEPVQLLRHELGQRASAGLVGPLLLQGQQMLLHHLEERSLLRLPARINRAGEDLAAQTGV